MDERKQNDKGVLIFVNTKEHYWPKEDISFKEVVSLAPPELRDRQGLIVAYENGPGLKPEGDLVAGGKSVKITKGMEFTVEDPDAS